MATLSVKVARNAYVIGKKKGVITYLNTLTFTPVFPPEFLLVKVVER